jgi:hypothetical protein
MESLPFIVPIAGAVFLVNAVWSCALGCRVRNLQQRIELLEDANSYTRTQAAREQLSVPVPVTVAQPIYYPPQTYMTGPPPPYRPQTSAPSV